MISLNHIIAYSFPELFYSECPADVMCNRFTDDGALLAVGLIDGSIRVSLL